MKDLITAIASLLVILIFVNQFFANQITHNNLALIEKEIDNFVNTAKQDGLITLENKQMLREGIAGILGANDSEIKVDGLSSNIVYRGGKIGYRIKIPLRRLLAASTFWNFTKSESERWITINQYTISERIDREF